MFNFGLKLNIVFYGFTPHFLFDLYYIFLFMLSMGSGASEYYSLLCANQSPGRWQSWQAPGTIPRINIDQPLAAILTLNTIAHTVGAIGVGSQASNVWPSEGAGLHIAGLHIGAEAIVATVMTLAILILSEIIPKTIGANYWQKLSPFTTLSLNFIIKALWPLVFVSQFITKKLKKDKSKSVLSRADFTAMAELGEKEGIFEQEESKILQNLLRFDTIQAKDIMTPRTVVLAADENMTIGDFYAENPHLHFSRIPVYRETLDHVTGYVLKDEMLSSIINKDESNPLKDIARNIVAVDADFQLPALFNQMMEKREHIALVVGQFGGMAGIVTMEDIIETLLGMEIVDEMDNIEDMQALARKNWEKRAKSLGLINKDNPQSE